ncbi:hypothetical protein ACPXB3_21900 [Gordonia sp. DT219]|uniref:hypothetical protein n=1 Tax=Gordonia sp. DT219 TaxID=3416658 RepID=UPI003CFA24EC
MTVDNPVMLRAELEQAKADVARLRTELAETERERVRLRDMERKTAGVLDVANRNLSYWISECENANRRADEAQQAQEYWREQAMDDVDRLNIISEIEPDATNPAHWRWAADLLGAHSHRDVFRWSASVLRARADRLEHEHQQAALHIAGYLRDGGEK